MTDSHLTAALSLGRDGASRVGQDRIRLLEAIARQGSISAAAREVGLSYKAAWDAVGTLNNLFPEPLVAAAPGGRKGGGATVTPAGHALIASFARLQDALDAAARRLDRELAGLAYPPATLFRNIMMQTSTRNAYRCTVTKVIEGAVNSIVEMKLTDELALTAAITERSASEMGIEPGTEVFALVKAPFIILAAGIPSSPVSARNVLGGTVASRRDGAVNSEIILDIGSGKSVTSIVTIDSAERLGLQPGDAATAMFKAGHVIVALP
ncbi:TOBE domain-containing protein [Mangrovicoccus sp. HB161399]|uniref:TOBE domain-containing protein n=1 Tax=Mangrovicoccus sp. HB161399 TaxID=2720392 RepID=UPI001556EC70|nr:TOBE domain-containing protein [Mangrovicoccus sp. HB161399]